MELLEIVQTLHYEAKLPGSPPAAVTGQSGRAADLVRWSIEAYNDIQREHNGRWKWLRREFTLDTVADDPDYVYGDCTDVDASGSITRFRAWDLNPAEQPLIYLVSDGQETERRLVVADWTPFRDLYRVGTHTADYPTYISRDWLDRLHLGPTPNGIYRVTGHFWRSNQTLVLDDDKPEMPADYHMLVVYRAIVKYAYNSVAHEVLARAQSEGTSLYDSLVGNQLYALETLSAGGPLA